jgi:hypothetical protein
MHCSLNFPFSKSYTENITVAYGCCNSVRFLFVAQSRNNVKTVVVYAVIYYIF